MKKSNKNPFVNKSLNIYILKTRRNYFESILFCHLVYKPSQDWWQIFKIFFHVAIIFFILDLLLSVVMGLFI